VKRWDLHQYITRWSTSLFREVDPAATRERYVVLNVPPGPSLTCVAYRLFGELLFFPMLPVIMAAVHAVLRADRDGQPMHR
jgi:hypothetical protein